MEKARKTQEKFKQLSPAEQRAEVMANFVGNTLFGTNEEGLKALTTEISTKKHSKALQFILDFFSWIKKKFSGDKINKDLSLELSNIEEKFKRMVQDAAQNKEEYIKKRKEQRAKIAEQQKNAQKNTTSEGDRFSVVEPFADDNGNYYENAILLDTRFFDGISPRNWGEKLKNYVESRSTSNPIIWQIKDENGELELLQFAKPNERTRKNGGSEHKVLDKLSSTSDNISKLAVIHIDEIVSESDENSPYYSSENNHGWLDKKGWLHRNVNVINAKNGAVYNIILDIAKTNDGRLILYATDGKIRKVGNVNVNSLKIKGSRQNSNLKTILSKDTQNVNTKFSIPSSTETEYSEAVANGDMETAQRLVDEAAKKAGYNDNNGNVIPLSERFNPENEDIRYSVPEADEVSGKEKAEELKGKLGEESKKVKELRGKQIELSQNDSYKAAVGKLKGEYKLDNLAAAFVLTARPKEAEGLFVTLKQMGFSDESITEMFKAADKWQQDSGYRELQSQIDEIHKAYDITQDEILEAYTDEYGAVKEGAKPRISR